MFVSDTFTEGGSNQFLDDHTGETGATWTVGTGGAADALVVIAAADNLQHDAGAGIYYASGTPADDEYDVEADFIGAAAGQTGITGRHSTSAQTYYLAYWSLGDFKLYKTEAGSFTELGSFTQALSGGTPYAVKLEIRDATKKVYVDDVERISSGDNAITAAGRAGVHMTQASVHLDNYVATDAGGGGGLNPLLLFACDMANVANMQDMRG